MIYFTDDTAAAVRRGLAAARDRSHPDDAGRSPAKYARMSRDFRAGAWKHLLDDVDLPQASNKGWGMVAETVKAISAHHGGIIHTHRAIWTVLGELSALAGQSEGADTEDWINNAFGVARNLHTNFYEDDETAAQVASNLRLCEQLSQLLYQMFWPEGANASD